MEEPGYEATWSLAGVYNQCATAIRDRIVELVAKDMCLLGVVVVIN